MSKEPIPDDPTDDELESLAQDLFGVRLSEQNSVEPFDIGEFDLDEIEEDSEPDSMTEPGAAPDDDAFGGSLLDDESDPAAPQAKFQTEPVTSRDETDAEDALVDADSGAEESSTSDAHDDYWDALDGFDWNEESDASQTKPQMIMELVEPSDTFEDFSIESAEKTEEFVDDADFGAGLDEDDRTAAAVTVTREAESEEESEEETSHKGGRRRGRRRRGRRRDQQTAEKGDSTEPVASDRQERLDDAKELDDEETPADESSGDDGFGAGLDIEVEDAQEQPPKKRRRRRGGRRRGSRKPEDEVPSGASADESPRERPPAKPAAGSAEKTSNADKYRSVPTWEEAIGYLVRHKGPQSGGGSSKGNTRGGSRRGSGRRRRS